MVGKQKPHKTERNPKMVLRYTMTEMVQLAEKAQQPIDQFIRTAQVIEEYQEHLHSSRVASTDDKAAIKNYLDTFEGDLADLDSAEILKRSGVRLAQGTSAFVKREVKRVQLLRKSA